MAFAGRGDPRKGHSGVGGRLRESGEGEGEGVGVGVGEKRGGDEIIAGRELSL